MTKTSEFNLDNQEVARWGPAPFFKERKRAVMKARGWTRWPLTPQVQEALPQVRQGEPRIHHDPGRPAGPGGESGFPFLFPSPPLVFIPLVSPLQSINVHIDENALHEILNEVDLNKNGQVELDEFMQVRGARLILIYWYHKGEL